MSIRLMGVVFALEIAASEKLVLLAMADHARDDGTGCYPSIDLLARKTSQSRRGVQKIMRRLEDAGLISPSRISRGGPRRSTEYKLIVENCEPRSLFSSTQPRTAPLATANAGTPNGEPQGAQLRTGFARIIKNRPEPSVNLARHSPRSSSPVEKEFPQARNHRTRYVEIGRLQNHAIELLRVDPNKSLGDLAEQLKQWAADNGIRYFDACPGAATPIQQAITNALAARRSARASEMTRSIRGRSVWVPTMRRRRRTRVWPTASAVRAIWIRGQGNAPGGLPRPATRQADITHGSSPGVVADRG